MRDWRCRIFGHRGRGYMGCECRRCGAWWVFDHWTEHRVPSTSEGERT